MSQTILDVTKVTMRFGGITAVSDLTFQVQRGQIFSVIGPNGAGKTTVFNVITGLYQPTSGLITFGGESKIKAFTLQTLLGCLGIAVLVALMAWFVATNPEALWKVAFKDPYGEVGAKFNPGTTWTAAWQYLTTTTDLAKPMLVAGVCGFFFGLLAALVIWFQGRRTPDGIAIGGVARTFQNIRLFQNMTVMENVLIGMDRTLSRNVFAMSLRLPGLYREEIAAEKKAIELLKFVGLSGKSGELAKNLAYGDQRRLEIARALATESQLLLLDEPAAGMNPSETSSLMDLIRKIRDRGVTIVLIEHHMKLVMQISDRIAVLDYGEKIAEGTPAEISRNPKVIEAYLGKEEVS